MIDGNDRSHDRLADNLLSALGQKQNASGAGKSEPLLQCDCRMPIWKRRVEIRRTAKPLYTVSGDDKSESAADG
jgi:hypothetical protein